MSHYSVAVIVNRLEEVDILLAPFDENKRVKPYVKYTKEELIQKEKERIQNYAKTTYAEYLKDPVAYEERTMVEGHIQYIKEEFPKMLTARDEDIYQHAIRYYASDEIGENGEVYSTYNPKSKWDWYEIGGRYRDELLVKADNVNISQYKTSRIDLEFLPYEPKPAPEGYKWVDAAKIKDICWDKMKEEGKKEYQAACRYWEITVEGQPLQKGEEKPFVMYKKEYYLERYSGKEQYANTQTTFHTFAFLTSEGWVEKGEMGWFGMSSTTQNSEQAFIDAFQTVIANPDNQDKYLVIVDCHI